MGVLVGIIGAGLAGLSTAKTLKMFGFQVVVFEQRGDVGGVWSGSRRYPGLTTQNPRDTYAFSDFPMPSDYPEWPSGAQMQSYLDAYVDRFRLRGDIYLNREVTAATALPNGAGWTLTVARTDGTASETRTHAVDWLVVCNGIFSIPSVPDYPGAAAFAAGGGMVRHTSQFADIAAARGKHVLVVGYGKSSCDVANAVAEVAASTTVVTRNVLWKIPKKLGGVLNYKHLLLTRLGEALFPYIRLRGFEAFFHGPAKAMPKSMLGSVESVVAKQLKLRETGLHPGTPLATIARSTVSLATDGFHEKVAAGRLRVVKSAAIVRLGDHRAELSTGESVPADVVICGTGWDQRADFIDPSVAGRVTDARGNFRLYRSMLPVGVPRLAFNGYNSSFFSQLNAEVGALWLVDHMSGKLRLPPEHAQLADIDARLAWMEARTDGKHAKGTNIIPFSVHHMDELLADINLPLPLGTRLKHWLLAINAADYAPLQKRLLHRHGIDARAAYAPPPATGAVQWAN
jgi:cation diffusion facilitator CzcD-associated flavoprotein CzcO